MTEEEKLKLIEEKQSEISGLKNLLSQGDYKARKMLAEVCVIVKEQLGVSMPIYEHYLEEEEKAQTFRDRINVLQAEISELTN